MVFGLQLIGMDFEVRDCVKVVLAHVHARWGQLGILVEYNQDQGIQKGCLHQNLSPCKCVK